MIHIYLPFPPLEGESLLLVVQFVLRTKVSGLGDKMGVKVLPVLCRSVAVSLSGATSAQRVRHLFSNLHKTSPCADKALCPCVWWMNMCLLFRWAAPLLYLNVILQKGGLASTFNSFFIIYCKRQEADISCRAQEELWRGSISALPGYSLNFHCYYFILVLLLLLHLRVGGGKAMDLKSGNLKSEP